MIRALSLLIVLQACRTPGDDTGKDSIDTAPPRVDQDDDGYPVDEDVQEPWYIVGGPHRRQSPFGSVLLQGQVAPVVGIARPNAKAPVH